MAHLVTGYAGKAHIKSADDGAYNAAFFGAGQYVLESGNDNCFAGSIVDNNTVRILDGEGLMYGRHFRIEPKEYEDMLIETGTTGMNRIDLICMTYEKNVDDGKETAYLEVIKGTETSGTAVAPEFTNGNILQGAILNQMPLYKVTVKGVVLSKIEPMFAKLMNYEKLAEVYYQKHEQLADEYYQKYEDKVNESVAEITEIPKNVLAQVELNSAKLEALTDLGAGSGVWKKEISLSSTINADEASTVYTFTEAETDDLLEREAWYSYLLETDPGKVQTVRLKSVDTTNFKDIVGWIDVEWVDKYDSYLHRRQCPLFHYLADNPNMFTIDFSISGLSRLVNYSEGYGYVNGFSGSKIVMTPHIFKNAYSGETNGTEYYSLEKFETTVELAMGLELTCNKTGYRLDKITGGGKIPDYSGEGTTNYEELENKPTINGVELTGDLTSEQLGLGGGEGGVSSLTDLGVEATAEELNFMTNVTSNVQEQLNDKDNRLKTLEDAKTPTIVYSEIEPETVAENTIVYVYETESE